MDLVLIVLISTLASALTLFSGFGLGTILLPVFALFLPAPMAVAATAIVHAANNLLKGLLLWRLADFKIVFKFGLPAIVASYFGATLLFRLSDLPTILSWHPTGIAAEMTPIKLVLGILILGFALFELLPKLQRLSFHRKYLPLGGLLSGFFGGLSGHQGAFRAAFLAKVDTSPQGFVGTNALIALLVDIIRLFVYGATFEGLSWKEMTSSGQGVMILTGILAAFSGVVIGRQFLHKVTMKTIRTVTGGLLILIGLVLTAGLI